MQATHVVAWVSNHDSQLQLMTEEHCTEACRGQPACTPSSACQVQDSLLAGMLRVLLSFDLRKILTNPTEHVQRH